MTVTGMDQMPTVGFGLWKIPPDQAADVVYQAIKAGYRHFDSACDYGNEKEVGRGLKRAIDEGLVTRDALWITSKLWNLPPSRPCTHGTDPHIVRPSTGLP